MESKSGRAGGRRDVVGYLYCVQGKILCIKERKMGKVVIFKSSRKSSKFCYPPELLDPSFLDAIREGLREAGIESLVTERIKAYLTALGGLVPPRLIAEKRLNFKKCEIQDLLHWARNSNEQNWSVLPAYYWALVYKIESRNPSATLTVPIKF